MSLRPVDDVIAQLLEQVTVTQKTERRSLEAALNCCLAEDVRSQVDVPPADNSAMDGFALAFGDTQANEVFDVSDRIPAGYVGQKLEPGTVARIFTGAQIPEGADTVVMQENTEQLDESRIRLLKKPEKAENVRNQGQDISTGTVVQAVGDRLSARSLSLIASVGVAEVQIRKPLTVAIMSTGDELVEPGNPLAPGQIYNSNRYALAGMLRQMGLLVQDLGVVEDTPEATVAALTHAAETADCIVTTGGVSVGEEDHVKTAVEDLGQLDIWKLAIKPGKPLAFGEVLGKPFFGLPGNPVSTFVTFHVIARAYLLAMQGYTNIQPEVTVAHADFSFNGGGRREYLRVRTRIDDGRLVAEKFPNQGSGIMTSVVWADALAEVEQGQTVKPGDLLKIYPVSLC